MLSPAAASANADDDAFTKGQEMSDAKQWDKCSVWLGNRPALLP